MRPPEKNNSGGPSTTYVRKERGGRRDSFVRNLGAFCELCVRTLSTGAAILWLAGCAHKPPVLPSGNGTPFPGFAAAYDEATSQCRDVRTITVSIGLSGKAGATKLRGHIDAGFAAPASARLEGVAPFGKPVFVLVADGDRSTLVLPRDDRVLRDASPAAIVEALAGVEIDPAAMRALVAGCGFGGPAPAAGQTVGEHWAAGSSGADTIYVRQAGGRWRVAGARRGTLTAIYVDDNAGRPASIHLRAESSGVVTADLTLRLSQVDMNPTLDPRTFKEDVPPDATPITLDELRRNGPLGGGAKTPNAQFPTPQGVRVRSSSLDRGALWSWVLGVDS